MSKGTNATEGVDREGQKEDVVSKKVVRDDGFALDPLLRLLLFARQS